jgi:hypothetical protein
MLCAYVLLLSQVVHFEVEFTSCIPAPTGHGASNRVCRRNGCPM